MVFVDFVPEEDLAFAGAPAEENQTAVLLGEEVDPATFRILEDTAQGCYLAPQLLQVPVQGTQFRSDSIDRLLHLTGLHLPQAGAEVGEPPFPRFSLAMHGPNVPNDALYEGKPVVHVIHRSQCGG